MGQKYPRPAARDQEIQVIEQAVASIRSALDVLRQAGSEPADQDQNQRVLSASIEQVRAAAAAIASAAEHWPATPVSSDDAAAPPKNARRSTG
ncbi:MAG: hypothetical protein J0H14_07745 [Alphaproteobacteria bacterium]|nr:hypothetical protein [Alphaproteobacteria bacterium]